MIAHQDPVVNLDPQPVFVFTADLMEPAEVLIVMEDPLAIIPPGGDVIDHPRDRYSRLPWHPPSFVRGKKIVG